MPSFASLRRFGVYLLFLLFQETSFTPRLDYIYWSINGSKYEGSLPISSARITMMFGFDSWWEPFITVVRDNKTICTFVIWVRTILTSVYHLIEESGWVSRLGCVTPHIWLPTVAKSDTDRQTAQLLETISVLCLHFNKKIPIFVLICIRDAFMLAK